MRLNVLSGPIAKGTIRTTFVLGLRLVVQSGTLLLVARMLGPRQFGAFAAVSALAVIMGTISSFGTHVVLIESVSLDQRSKHSVLAYAIPTTGICGGAMLGLYFLIVLWGLPEIGINIRNLIAIGVTELLLQPLYGLPIAQRLASGQVARSQLLQILPLALRLAAAAAAFTLQPANPLAAYVTGYIGASLVALGFVTVTTPDCWPSARAWRLPDRYELKHAAGYAASNFTSNGPGEIDKTLAAKLLPLAAAGLYSAGARVITAATLPVVAMMLSAVPRLFRDGRTHRPQTSHVLHWVLAATLGYGLLLAIILWSVAPLVGWIFGEKYNGLTAMIRWMCLAVPGLTLRVAIGTALVTFNKPWFRVGYEVAGLLVLSAAATVLTIRVGPAGMPAALALAESVMAGMGLALVARIRRPR